MTLKIASCAAILAVFLAAGAPALADDERVQERIATQFSGFAGSPGNAENLVTGLRNGTPITLIGGSPPETVAFSVPTRPMGNGNVFISMSLTQKQLANAGITNPTPSQLEAAMVGGTITVNGQTQSFQGVLAMRAQGMGWGQIAQSLGTKLGTVMSGMKAATAQQQTQAAKPGSGVTTAAGASASGNLRGHQGNGRGSGIVTASGTSVRGSGGGIKAGGSGQGSGIVTASGAAAGAAAGAQGHGNAGGTHGKGH